MEHLMITFDEYKLRVHNEMRNLGATDDEIAKWAPDDVISVAIKNNSQPENIAWALVQ